MKVSVITPVHNREDLTAQFLFQHSAHYPDLTGIQLIMLDNGSTDGTPITLNYWQRLLGSNLMHVRHDTNIGFPKACNIGAALAKHEILVFLNNDIVIDGDYLTPLVETLAGEKQALAGANLIKFDTGWNRFDGMVIPYLVGWCLAVRKDDFETLGGFDERYSPADYEDLDFCYHASRKGYELIGLDLPLRHLGNQTGKLLAGRRKITEANREKFCEKWEVSYEIERV